MLNQIYSIYDRKAQLFLPVFSEQSDAQAIRTFTETVTMTDIPVAKYPADFDLVGLGSLDITTGQVTPHHPFRLIINGLVCLENASRERQRYQAILSAPQAEENATDAS